MKTSINRRGFLKGAGGAALAVPLLQMPGMARAQRADIPKRFVVFYTNQGLGYDTWRPQGRANGGAYQLGASMSPLERHRDQLLICTGIHAQSAIHQNSLSPGNAHGLAAGHNLVGRRMLPGGANADYTLAGGPSIDHVLSQRITAEGVPIRAVHMGIRASTEPCFTGPAQPVNRVDDPRDVANLLFGDFFRQDGRSVDSIRRRRSSVMDAVRRNLRAVQNGLSPSDQRQLDDYLARIGDLDRRVSTPYQRPDQCEFVQFDDVGPSPERPDLDRVPQFHPYYDPNIAGDLMVDATVQALACRRTQVATLFYGDVEHHFWMRNSNGGRVGTQGYNSWHDMVHAYWQDGNPDYQSPAIRDLMMTADRWRHAQLARLLDGLGAVSEGDGTLLDHTVVLFLNEFGDETHSHTNLPFIVAGGSALGVNTGQWLDFGGQPHNRLYLSLLRAFGGNDTTFGDPQFCAGGPLPGVVG